MINQTLNPKALDYMRLKVIELALMRELNTEERAIVIECMEFVISAYLEGLAQMQDISVRHEMH